MDRPVTSKARGICKYYDTPQGCFNGNRCKFLHGKQEKLTPYDKAKTCQFFIKGYCKRGDQCWFRHATPPTAPTQEEDTADHCCICLEVPITYGLLMGCSHVFCIQCIRQWRDREGKSLDVVMSGVHKMCPLCRASSRFIIPSSHFYPQENPRKSQAVEEYRSSMARTPCKYFQETKTQGRALCPFGKDCFYQHMNDDGTPHIFPSGKEISMDAYHRHRHGRSNNLRNMHIPHPFDLIHRIFGTQSAEDIFEAIQANLPIFYNARINNEDGYHNEEEEHVFEDPNNDQPDGIQTLERLADHMLAALTDWQFQETVGAQDGAWDAVPPAWANGEITQIREAPSASIGFVHADTPIVANPSTELGPDPGGPRSPQPSTGRIIFGELDDADLGLLHNNSDIELTPSISGGRNSSDARRFTNIFENASMVIDLVSDDEDEDEDEDDNESQVYNDREPLESGQDRYGTEVSPQIALPESAARSPDLVVEHDVDPPFVTDGRGRVVWSNTRDSPQPQSPRRAGAKGRRIQAVPSVTEVIESDHPPSVPVSPNPRDSGIVTDGRGTVVWAGGATEVSVGGEGDSERNSRRGLGEEESSDQTEQGRGLLGRIIDAVFWA